MGNAMSQSFRIPEPKITEKNCPDQTGHVHLVTGGYGGCGLELSRILYGANADVWIAGRSQEKADKAIAHIKEKVPSSKGSLHFLELDLQDLPTIPKAVEQFTSASEKLHVLTLNAGVMMPPYGSKGAQGHELQMATNCLGPFLLFKGLLPTLQRTARAQTAPGTVRVTWAASLVVEVSSPKGGITFPATTGADNDKIPAPAILGKQRDYSQSKAGNLFLASELGVSRPGYGRDDGIVHVAWNPGNLTTDLTRHGSFIERFLIRRITYPPVYGGYTELWAAVAPELNDPKKVNGSYIAPWGRLLHNRADIDAEKKKGNEGQGGNAARFLDWCEQEVAPYVKDAPALDTAKL